MPLFAADFPRRERVGRQAWRIGLAELRPRYDNAALGRLWLPSNHTHSEAQKGGKATMAPRGDLERSRRHSLQAIQTDTAQPGRNAVVSLRRSRHASHARFHTLFLLVGDGASKLRARRAFAGDAPQHSAAAAMTEHFWEKTRHKPVRLLR